MIVLQVYFNLVVLGFNVGVLDEKVIVIVDLVMEVMGGWCIWDQFCYFYWNFFNWCILFWDKKIGNVWIMMLLDSSIVMVFNLNIGEGQAWVDGVFVMELDSLENFL